MDEASYGVASLRLKFKILSRPWDHPPNDILLPVVLFHSILAIAFVPLSIIANKSLLPALCWRSVGFWDWITASSFANIIIAHVIVITIIIVAVPLRRRRVAAFVAGSSFPTAPPRLRFLFAVSFYLVDEVFLTRLGCWRRIQCFTFASILEDDVSVARFLTTSRFVAFRVVS